MNKHIRGHFTAANAGFKDIGSETELDPVAQD